ncbi:hypothetical protein FOL47_001515 [Perkinsus chesapeaki]|uniref:Uncharacterized protein n=1 Tax=Perkinsus chesapeaki TaxID=330153 RepID=A0A7J6KU45_PERCH|nr:hypothetical protein FOL47_001515 [Perkinsus chesapeaki]
MSKLRRLLTPPSFLRFPVLANLVRPSPNVQADIVLPEISKDNHVKDPPWDKDAKDPELFWNKWETIKHLRATARILRRNHHLLVDKYDFTTIEGWNMMFMSKMEEFCAYHTRKDMKQEDRQNLATSIAISSWSQIRPRNITSWTVVPYESSIIQARMATHHNHTWYQYVLQVDVEELLTFHKSKKQLGRVSRNYVVFEMSLAKPGAFRISAIRPFRESDD